MRQAVGQGDLEFDRPARVVRIERDIAILLSIVRITRFDRSTSAPARFASARASVLHRAHRGASVIVFEIAVVAFLGTGRNAVPAGRGADTRLTRAIPSVLDRADTRVTRAIPSSGD